MRMTISMQHVRASPKKLATDNTKQNVCVCMYIYIHVATLIVRKIDDTKKHQGTKSLDDLQ